MESSDGAIDLPPNLPRSLAAQIARRVPWTADGGDSAIEVANSSAFDLSSEEATTSVKQFQPKFVQSYQLKTFS